MAFWNIKPWHIGIGLPVFSAVLLASFLQLEPRPNPRTTSPMIFEQAALSRPVGRDNPQPLVSNVRVYPPIEGLYTVNFVQLVPDRQGDRWLRQEWSFTARTPRTNSTETIPEWFARLREQNPSFQFTYEWWREPGRVWPIWAGASGLLFAWGVLLPAVMWVVKGGPGRLKREIRAPSASPAAASQAPVVTAADRDRLDEMIDRLQASTASGGAGSSGPGGGAAGAEGQDRPNAPKILSNKPLEAAPVLDKPEEPKEYKGEYYPVAKPTVKKETH